MMGEQKVDVEEGEISESTSVVEITEEDFRSKKPEDQEEDIVVVSDPNPKQSSSDPRVWTMQDLYKYGPGYARGLYNFAWAQAVQNKPLPTPSPTGIENHTDNSSTNDRGATNNDVVIVDSGDDENELMDVVMEEEDVVQEMELEEGEIDLDSDVVIKNKEKEVETSNAVIDNDGRVDTDDNANKNDQLATEMTNGLSSSCNELVSSLRKDLEKVNFDEAKKSFGVICFLLHSALERTQSQVLGLEVQAKHELVQLAFSAVQVVISVFGAMNQKDKENNKEKFSRLISLTTSQNPFLFNPEQLNEIKVMMSSLSTTGFLCNKVSNLEEDKSLVDGKLKSKSSSLGKNEPSMLTEALKSEVSTVRVRGGQAPLLDLHKDHDTDSLPSPTSKSANPLFAHKAMTAGDGTIKPEIATARMPHANKSSMIRTYETEALNAVSTYQQKFARTSVFANDRLPSPTPSDEGDSGDADTTTEVSSSYFGTKINDIGPPNLSKSAVTFVPSNDGFNGVVPSSSLTSLPSSGLQSSLKVSSKSRDPRLRFIGSDSAKMEVNRRPSPTVNSRIPDPFEDPTVLKKPKTVTSDGSLAAVKCVDGGWLEDIGSKYQFDNRRNDPRKMATGMVSSTIVSAKPAVTTATELPVTSIAASLPGLWKFAVNPTMLLDPTKLLDIIQKGQRSSLSEETKPLSRHPSISASNDVSSSSVPEAVFSMNVSPSKLSAAEQKPEVVLSTPPQVDSMDPGKFRMKPRDPRRVLHQVNKVQTSESLRSNQSRVNATSTLGSQGSKDILNLQMKEDQTIAQSLPSTVAAPDIARQFTKSLENIATIMSSQTATTPTSLKEEVNSNNVDGRVADIKEQNSGVGSKPEVTAVTSHPHAWGDVEHLFDGYDDHQLAAIQKERARRIEEQKKMFASRKLCLVLDLDHTLLNSAKFVEVDPAHDEILRKKEEQDREKPDRHLFRFPHMGMWTKLRPGIWNFLEKASKLYELHLYTMGNKLYASEMAKVLDPKGVLFSGRVISRGDDGDLFDGEERIPKSKDLEGVLGMESAVVIIDDSVKVWPHNKLNLIVVERYIYFPCSRRQFALPGPSLLEIDHDERPEDGTLASSLAVIEKIHQNFFSNRFLDEVDVRNILASEQQKILAGCRIVFSRVIPVGSNPHLNQLWQTAEQFGAVCTNQLDDQVTHVVANSLGTDKVNWGLSTGKHVIYPGCCDWTEAQREVFWNLDGLERARGAGLELPILTACACSSSSGPNDPDCIGKGYKSMQ